MPKQKQLKYAPVPSCSHRGEAVSIGGYSIFAGGLNYLRPEDFGKADIVIPLESRVPALMGQQLTVLACPWRDYEPPPPGFETFLRAHVIPAMQQGRKVLVYCIGSHGRTGTFLASLIAVMEPKTQDPIAAVRERHCHKAVETLQQAQYVFGLRALPLPGIYQQEFGPQKTKKVVLFSSLRRGDIQ